MKTVGIIPSRMNSVRFPGKALTDIRGIPMVVRVFQAARTSGVLDEIYVATDSPEIASACRSRNIPILMTAGTHPNPTSRTAEAASMADADFYVMLGGDEPLLHPEDIRNMVKNGIPLLKSGFVVNAMAAIHDPDEAADSSNIKVICDAQGRGISAFRQLGSAEPPWYKFVSIGLYTKEALEYFTLTPPGPQEEKEHFDLLRFMEHGKSVSFLEICHRTLSVDTPADLEKVLRILKHTEEILGFEKRFTKMEEST